MGDLKTVGDLIFVDHLFFVMFLVVGVLFFVICSDSFKMQSLFLCHDRAVGCCISSTQCVCVFGNLAKTAISTS